MIPPVAGAELEYLGSILPLAWILNLSVFSVVTFTCPSVPVSIVSTFVLPVSIFVVSTDIPVKFAPLP